MNKKIRSGIMLTLLSIGMLTLAFNIQQAKASLTVHNIDSGEDFSTIHEAIDDPDTLNGHTILVDSGTYYEHVTIDKSISLVGEDKHSTIIDGNSRTVIVITADNVNVSNFTIRNGFPGDGVKMKDCSGNRLNNNIIENNLMAIELDKCSDNTIVDNQVSSIPPHWFGIFLYSSNDNTLTNNTALDVHVGIFLGGSNQNLVNRNNVNSRFFGIRLAGSNNNTIVANEVVGNRWGVYIAQYRTPVENNLVYHNNFVNNTDYQGSEWNSTNTWDNDYPYGGNYWSNYTGVDLYSGVYQNESGSDGIGDTPYIIPFHGNQDIYPLMEPWAPPTMIKTLIRTVRFWNLHHGTENSLTSKLEGTLLLLEIGNENGVAHKLTGLIKQVEALRGKILTNERANYLISEAQRIIDLTKG